MPHRPNTPCKHPGCARLVPYGTMYCEEHKALHPETTRPAGKRGYGSRWRRESKAFLQAHPLCVRCLASGKYVRATVVDHIVPHRGDQKLFWLSCKSLHNLVIGSPNIFCCRLSILS